MCKHRGWTVSTYEYGCACASVYDRVEDFGVCHMLSREEYLHVIGCTHRLVSNTLKIISS